MIACTAAAYPIFDLAEARYLPNPCQSRPIPQTGALGHDLQHTICTLSSFSGPRE